MTPEQQAAFVNAAAARAMIRAMGMDAQNRQCWRRGDVTAYGEAAFVALIDEEGISHNAVMMALAGPCSGY